MKKLLLLPIIAGLILSGCGLDDSTSSNNQVEGANQHEEKNVASTNEFIEDTEHLIDHYSKSYLSLSDDGKAFIKKHLDFFINQSDSSIELAKSRAEPIDLKKLNKNATPFLTTFTSFSGYIIQIEEFDYGDTTVTFAIIEEDYELTDYEYEPNYFTLILFDTTENVFDEDYVTFYGLPIGKYAYENVLGGHTYSQMFLSSSIEKSE